MAKSSFCRLFVNIEAQCYFPSVILVWDFLQVITDFWYFIYVYIYNIYIIYIYIYIYQNFVRC